MSDLREFMEKLKEYDVDTYKFLFIDDFKYSDLSRIGKTQMMDMMNAIKFALKHSELVIVENQRIQNLVEKHREQFWGDNDDES